MTTIYILILLFSVILHEVAHGWMAESLGDPTARLEGRITLNPLVHLDWLGSIILPALLIFSGAPFILGWAKPVPFNPFNFKDPKWGGAAVAAIGPLTNIALAVIAALLLAVTTPSGIFLTILHSAIITNIALAVFNLVPIPPLDGHHILFALLPRSLEHLTRSLRKLAWPLVFLFVIFGWRFIEPIIFWGYQLLV